MQTNKQPEGDVVVTTTEEGYIVCVTRQDEEGRILSILAEGKPPKEKEDTKLIEDLLYLVERFSHCDESRDYYMEIAEAVEKARKRLNTYANQT